MSSMMLIRRGLALVLFAGVLAASVLTTAQTAAPGERITATAVVGGRAAPAAAKGAVGAKVAGEATKIDLLRWSTDAERTKLLPALVGKDEKARTEALQGTPSLGYLWGGSSSLGAFVRYAERQPLAGGGERIVLVVERKLSSWQGKPIVDPKAAAAESPLTVVELRLGGLAPEGKVAAVSMIAADADGKGISIGSGFATAPIRLTSIKREGKAA